MKATVRSTAGCICTGLLASLATAQQVILATSTPISPQLITVDPTDGSILNSVPVTGHQALFGGLTKEGNTLYSIDGYNDGVFDRTFRIDATTGSGAVVGDTGFNWNFRCVEIHPLTGVLHATTDNQLYTLDKNTGAAASVAPINGATLDQFTAFAIDSTGAAYGLDIGGTGLFALDLATGAATHLGDLSLSGFVQDCAFDSAGDLWVVQSNGLVHSIDVNTLTPTFEFSASGWGGFTFSGCAAPAAYCTVGTSSTGCAPTISSTGTPSSTASSGFTLTSASVDALRNGLFFYGLSNPAFVPTQWGPGGSSFLCVKPPTQRMSAMSSGGISGCTGSFAQDWNAFMAANPGALGNPRMLGQSFDAQLWMRDPASAKTTILSDGLRFTLCQ